MGRAKASLAAAVTTSANLSRTSRCIWEGRVGKNRVRSGLEQAARLWCGLRGLFGMGGCDGCKEWMRSCVSSPTAGRTQTTT